MNSRYDGVLIYKDWTICGYLPAIMKEVVENKVMVCFENFFFVFEKTYIF